MICALLFAITAVHGDTHSYTPGEDVILWFNKALPSNNPQETYAYSKLPLCRGDREKRNYFLGLGEAIEGYELQDSGMSIKFLENLHPTVYCHLKLGHEDTAVLVNAILKDFWVQMYLDDLPVWTPLGTYSQTDGTVSLYTHLDLYISYNSNNVIQVHAQAEKPVIIYNQKTRQKTASGAGMKYSLTWKPTLVTFDKRFESYLDPGFFENNIHWFSILNSFVMVLLLCGFVLMILSRALKKDFAKYETQELEPIEFIVSAGWKQMSGDAFRAPSLLYIFAGLLGQGWQLAFVVLVGLVMSAIYPMYSERGAFTSVSILAYSCLGILSGFACSFYYSINNGRAYVSAILFGSLVYPVVAGTVSLGLNFYAIWYSSSAAVPFITLVEVMVFLGFVYMPLYLIGFRLGKGCYGKWPVRNTVNLISAPILKEKQWYSEPALLIILSGLLPFASISVEIYFIFTSFWNYKFYYVYGFAMLGFLILVLSLVCVGAVVSYIFLNSEDYRWHWVTYLGSGSLGGYIYLYSFYYYLFRTKMTGPFQLSFYFGYTGLASFTVFLISGSIGYTGAYFFVKSIYRSVKVE